ncbi:YhjD/YihY/BrkB family envelope integrity protein [Amycolatopsis mongoliensis]|uniref:YhjD/YihY/BrkB family envelope integrity protein n=1 Tax=Amycolatopsis mongoliensis TaxID=715475 RepID=A0A9Y2JQJ0_9PSEU|nr:YhjD/YihY/BrkB family envelope integrity protein [Amycolatopsis sp. 4-36]WIY01689.1 YhjD/YihY/BrkB family envelope integrity protein [Amycolatopsis sp. 4-36]
MGRGAGKAVVGKGIRRAGATLARYRERDGDHYAAAVTFFSLLALVPLIMVAVSVAGFVLAGDRLLATELDRVIDGSLPPEIGGPVTGVVHTVVGERGRIGLLALAFAAYSGWSWISNVRDAVTAMLGQERTPRPLLRGIVADVLALAGVGLALAVSFGLAALTGAAGTWLLHLTGLGGGFAHFVLVAGSLLLGLAANWLVIAWCLARLPRRPLPLRSTLRPAVAAAAGLGAIQQAGGFYLHLLGRSPAVAAFGTLVGVLLFVYLIVRWLLMVTVWLTVRDERPAGTLAADVRYAGTTLGAGASAELVVRTLAGR